MNIQQLNSSGQAIQTFLVTAVVLLLLTGGLWFCIEEVNEYRSWVRIDRPRVGPQIIDPPKSRSTYNILVRVMMLVWLYCRGHWAWVRKTGAWRDILTNSEPNERFRSRLPNVIHPLDKELSAGEYVSEYIGTEVSSGAFQIYKDRPMGTILGTIPP